MARPLRLEFPGALYHVTARGNDRQTIYADDDDRHLFLELLADEVRLQGWVLYAYCLMDNHYHLLLETPEAGLCKGMQRLNGRYTQRFNYRHSRSGHLFQGRYKAIIVEKDAHLLELCRYVVLNPVRAGVVEHARDWPWSSYAATLGIQPGPDWLACNALLCLFSEHAGAAREAYARFVRQGLEAHAPWEALRGQIYLGGDGFRQRMQALVPDKAADTDIPLMQKQLARPDCNAVLQDVAHTFNLDLPQVASRRNKEAFRTAVFLLRRACNLPLKKVAAMAGISPGRVSQIQSQMMRDGLHGQAALLLKKYKVKA